MFLESILILNSIITHVNSQTVQVKLKRGNLIGIREQTIFDGRYYYAFYGVPYAQPPVGKLRFKDPKPEKKWSVPFDASVEYHGSCAQSHIVHKHVTYGNEDCLTLNIYTPIIPIDKKSEEEILKPVAVWVHGYAFSSSFSHIYGADFLIEKDILFVSVAHRIGVFGFLKLNETNTDANMGLKDIVMALKWIRKYVHKFGGDKRRITVIGSDSGATFLSLLLITENRKLFSKMILQSGALFSSSLFQGNHLVEKQRLLQNLRKVGVLDISKASTTEIVTASQKIYSNVEVINAQKPLVPFMPIIEKKSNNSLLTEKPSVFYSSHSKLNISKPLLIGFTSQESISEVIPFLHNTKYLKYFTAYFKFMVPFCHECAYNYSTLTYRKIADEIKAYYFNSEISEKSVHSFIKYTSDLKKYPVWKFIKTHQAVTSTKMFVYNFNYVGGFNAVRATSLAGSNLKIKGASNGDELCYILKCEPLGEYYVKTNNDTTNRDRRFVKEITEMWANFIKKGNPTPSYQSTRITWPEMTEKEDKLLLLGNTTKVVGAKSETNMFSFWNALYDKYYAPGKCILKQREEL